jgi:hypothetical protein
MPDDAEFRASVAFWCADCGGGEEKRVDERT